jgi:hypothetical protein
MIVGGEYQYASHGTIPDTPSDRQGRTDIPPVHQSQFQTRGLCGR